MASFTDRSFGGGENCDSTDMNIQYTDTVNKAPVDDREEQGVQKKLSSLRSETKDFKRVVQRLFAPRCTFGLYTL